MLNFQKVCFQTPVGSRDYPDSNTSFRAGRPERCRTECKKQHEINPSEFLSAAPDFQNSEAGGASGRPFALPPLTGPPAAGRAGPPPSPSPFIQPKLEPVEEEPSISDEEREAESGSKRCKKKQQTSLMARAMQGGATNMPKVLTTF